MAVTAHTSTSGSPGASPRVFRPRVWRTLLLILAMSAVLIACIEAVLYAVGRLSTSDYTWVLLLAVWLVWSGYYTFTVYRHYAISVGATHVTGRSSGLGNWGWEQQQIFLDDLDPVRSAKRSWASRAFGNQRFYSTSGQSIYFLRAAFSRADVREILNMLGIRE